MLPGVPVAVAEVDRDHGKARAAHRIDERVDGPRRRGVAVEGPPELHGVEARRPRRPWPGEKRQLREEDRQVNVESHVCSS